MIRIYNHRAFSVADIPNPAITHIAYLWRATAGDRLFVAGDRKESSICGGRPQGIAYL
jgi:hypothetical protein